MPTLVQFCRRIHQCKFVFRHTDELESCQESAPLRVTIKESRATARQRSPRYVCVRSKSTQRFLIANSLAPSVFTELISKWFSLTSSAQKWALLRKIRNAKRIPYVLLEWNRKTYDTVQVFGLQRKLCREIRRLRFPCSNIIFRKFLSL